MTARKEYVLEVFSDQNFVKDIVRGVLHTIFFHRIFSSIRPDLFIPTSAKSYTSSRPQESLSIQLPAILEPPEVSAAIDAHTNALVNQLTSSSSMNGGGPRGEIVVQLHDRQRTRSQGTGWLSRFNSATAEEEVCWEQWVLQVIVARPRTDAGEMLDCLPGYADNLQRGSKFTRQWKHHYNELP